MRKSILVLMIAATIVWQQNLINCQIGQSIKGKFILRVQKLNLKIFEKAKTFKFQLTNFPRKIDSFSEYDLLTAAISDAENINSGGNEIF